MYHDYNFASVLSASARAAWQIEDVLPEGAALDFSRPFLPESLARTGAAEGLSAREQRVLNQIRGHEYLVIFGLLEEFILPFVLDHARPQLNGDDARVRALLNFASEEAKHIDLFKRFHARFLDGFGSECGVIGPPEAVAAEVLRHDPLAVALVILHIEWMTQSHYVGSVRDDGCSSNGAVNNGQVEIWVGFENGSPEDVVGVEIVGPEGNTVADVSIDLVRIQCQRPCTGYTFFNFTNLDAGEYAVRVTRNGEAASATSFEVS